jgi:hypothetical protein
MRQPEKCSCSYGPGDSDIMFDAWCSVHGTSPAAWEPRQGPLQKWWNYEAPDAKAG